MIASPPLEGRRLSSTFAERVSAAAAKGRGFAAAFPQAVEPDALPWKVVEAYDADIRGHVERDPRLEDARDRVLITAVKLAEAGDAPEARAFARSELVAALDDLERTVLHLGRLNRQAAKLGFGAAGDPIVSPA